MDIYAVLTERFGEEEAMHVVLFDDETKEIAKEIVRCGGLDRVYMALDYFDASINRVSAWAMGFRSWQKALLSALCTPHERLKKLQDENKMTELMVEQEAVKTLPFGDIWNEYCERCGVVSDRDFYTENYWGRKGQIKAFAVPWHYGRTTIDGSKNSKCSSQKQSSGFI